MRGTQSERLTIRHTSVNWQTAWHPIIGRQHGTSSLADSVRGTPHHWQIRRGSRSWETTPLGHLRRPAPVHRRGLGCPRMLATPRRRSRTIRSVKCFEDTQARPWRRPGLEAAQRCMLLWIAAAGASCWQQSDPCWCDAVRPLMLLRWDNRMNC